MNCTLLAANCMLLTLAANGAPREYEHDVVTTTLGPLTITAIGHGTLMLSCSGTVVHVDPVAQMADYAALPKAAILLVTHEHGDHLDAGSIDLVRTTNTKVFVGSGCSGVEGAVVMTNGQSATVNGIKIEAVPAYNIVHQRSAGMPYHPKGSGNGYILTFGDTCVYIAGDSENTPEMKALKDIAVAFLPMNLPYTMTPEMVADAAKAFKPKILYPYHYGSTDPQKLVKLLKDEKGIEVRIRKLQ